MQFTFKPMLKPKQVRSVSSYSDNVLDGSEETTLGYRSKSSSEQGMVITESYL